MKQVNHVFNNIEEVIDYIEVEEKDLLSKERPQEPPQVIRPIENMFSQPFDERIMQKTVVQPNSIDYPFASLYNEASDDKFIINKLFSGRYSLKPNLKRRAFLFRGENEFHSPSYPSLFRINKASYLEDMILIDEMHVLLMNHPLVKLLNDGVMINGRKIAFEMNTYGLAQHYETKTGLMDLTSDINVAAFFATCYYDSKTKSYLPIEDESKEGVIYLFKFSSDRFSPKHCMENKPTLHTIGLQLFPRSGQQKGFLFDVHKGVDFNEQEEVIVIRFRHNAEKSKEFYDMMEGGKKIFPSDVLADYCNTMDRRVVSKAAIEANLKRNPSETYGSLKKQLESLGFTITESEPMFSSDSMNKFYNDLHNGGWVRFCEQIHIPQKCPEVSQTDLINLLYRDEYKRAFGYK